MKKNIEWLKKEIATEMIELEPNRKERWSDVKYQTLRDVAQKIYQLDEPEVKQLERKIRELASFNDELIRDNNQLRNELDNQEVLSQEWVDKNVIHIRGFGDIFKAEVIENLLVPKQELPVIPKYVADWIEDYMTQGFDLYPALDVLESNASNLVKIYRWYRDNTLEFTTAYLTKEYEVEEEPLYYALVKGHELITDESNFTCKYWNFNTYNGDVFPHNRLSENGKFSIEMSKVEWNKLGINDSNADFVRVEE